MFARLRKWWRFSDEALVLTTLDDRLLADMGFDRQRLWRQLEHGIEGAPGVEDAEARRGGSCGGALPPRPFRLAYHP